MGCNESKNNDVATGNTVSHRPLRKKQSKNSKDLESIPESYPNITGTNSLAQGPDSGNTDKGSNSNEIVQVTDMKDINVNPELKEGHSREEGNKEDHQVVTLEKLPGKLVTRDSPDHYFSSRKDGDAVESISTDEGYYSPRHEPVKGRDEKDNEVQQKDSVEEKDENMTELDKDTGKSEDLKVPILMKEANVMAKDEQKVMTTLEDSKNLVLVEELSSNPSPEEPKTK